MLLHGCSESKQPNSNIDILYIDISMYMYAVQRDVLFCHENKDESVKKAEIVPILQHDTGWGMTAAQKFVYVRRWGLKIKGLSRIET